MTSVHAGVTLMLFSGQLNKNRENAVWNVPKSGMSLAAVWLAVSVEDSN